MWAYSLTVRHRHDQKLFSMGIVVESANFSSFKLIVSICSTPKVLLFTLSLPLNHFNTTSSMADFYTFAHFTCVSGDIQLEDIAHVEVLTWNKLLCRLRKRIIHTHTKNTVALNQIAGLKQRTKKTLQNHSNELRAIFFSPLITEKYCGRDDRNDKTEVETKVRKTWNMKQSFV